MRRALRNFIYKYFFYNENICVAQVCDAFLPRDAIRKRGLCCRPVSVRPSVPLSDMHVGVLHPDG